MSTEQKTERAYLDRRSHIARYGDFYNPDSLPEEFSVTNNQISAEEDNLLMGGIHPEHAHFYEPAPKPLYATLLESLSFSGGEDTTGASMSGADVRQKTKEFTYRLTDEGQQFLVDARAKQEVPPEEFSVGDNPYPFKADHFHDRDIRQEQENFRNEVVDIHGSFQDAFKRAEEIQTNFEELKEESFRRLNGLGENEAGLFVARGLLTDAQKQELSKGKLMWDAEARDFRFIPEDEAASWGNMWDASWLQSSGGTVSELLFANIAFQGNFKQYIEMFEEELSDEFYSAVGYKPEEKNELAPSLKDITPEMANDFSMGYTLTFDNYFAHQDLPSDEVMRIKPPEGWTAEGQLQALKKHGPKVYSMYARYLGEEQLKEVTALAVNPHHWFFIANHTLGNAQAADVMRAFNEKRNMFERATAWTGRLLRDSVLASPDAGVDLVYAAGTLGTGVATNGLHRIVAGTSRTVGRRTIGSVRRKVASGQRLTLLEKFGRKNFRNWALDARQTTLNVFDNAGMFLPFRWDEAITQAALTGKHKVGRLLAKRASDSAPKAFIRGTGRIAATEYLASFIEEGGAGILNLNKTNQYLPYQAELHRQRGGSQVGQYVESFFTEGFYGGFMGLGLNKFMKGVNFLAKGTVVGTGKLGAWADRKVLGGGIADSSAVEGLTGVLQKTFTRIHLNSFGGRNKAYKIDKFKLAMQSALGDIDTAITVRVQREDGTTELVTVDASNVDQMENHPLMQMISSILMADRGVDEGLNRLEDVTLESEDGTIEFQQMPAWVRIINEAVNYSKTRAEENEGKPPTLEEVGMEIIERLVNNVSPSARARISANALKNTAVTTFVLETQALAMVERGEADSVEAARKILQDNPEMIISALAEQSDTFQQEVIEVMKERDQGDGSVFDGDPEKPQSLKLKNTPEAKAAVAEALNDPDVRLQAAQRLLGKAGERVTRDQLITGMINEHFGAVADMVGNKEYELTETDLDLAVDIFAYFDSEVTKDKLSGGFDFLLEMPVGDQAIALKFKSIIEASTETDVESEATPYSINIKLTEKNIGKIQEVFNLISGKEVVIGETDIESAEQQKQDNVSPEAESAAAETPHGNPLSEDQVGEFIDDNEDLLDGLDACKGE